MSLVQKHTFGDTREVEVVLEPGQHRLDNGTFVVNSKVYIKAIQKWTKNPRHWEDDFWQTTAYKQDTARPWEPPPPPPPPEPVPHPTSWWHRFWCGCTPIPKAEVVK